MTETESCKAIHVFPCIKGISNQVKDGDVEHQKDKGQIEICNFFHRPLLSLVAHMVKSIATISTTPIVEPMPQF